MQRVGVKPYRLIKVLAVFVLPILFTGCARFRTQSHAELLAESSGLSVVPSMVRLQNGQETVVFSLADLDMPDEAIPLEWDVSDPSLGRIVTSSAQRAVYRRSAQAGDNHIIVQDQLGNAGHVMIRQEALSEEAMAIARATGTDSLLAVDLAIVFDSEAGVGQDTDDDTIQREVDRSDVDLPEDGETVEAQQEESALVDGLDTEGDAEIPVLEEDASGMHATYRLSVGDQISIEVFREPEFSGTFQIESGGIIRHAFMGRIRLAGKTVRDAEEHLQSLLDERYLVNPRVTVRVLASQTAQVTVLGEVKSPGVHEIPFDESVTLLQVIGAAGGFTDLASVNRVRIMREEDGRQRRLRVRVSRIIAGRDADVPIEANDVIMVPQSFF